MKNEGHFCHHMCPGCQAEWRHVIPTRLHNSSFMDAYFSPCVNCQPDGGPPARVRNWFEEEA